MKITSFLCLLVFLASCGTETVVVEEAIIPEEVIEQTSSEINTELKNLSATDGDMNSSEDDDINSENITTTDKNVTIKDGDTTISIDNNTIVVEEDKSSVSIDKDDVIVSGDAIKTDSPDTKVVKVQAIYENPKQEVFINMEYQLDNNGKITKIDMTDTNYNQNNLQENLQVLLGKSVDEIDETYISGGSLTIPAVKEALTSQ